MSWLSALIKVPPEEGCERAIKLSGVVVKKTQPDDAARKNIFPDYAHNADSPTQASQVVAINFQTVSLTNSRWR